MAQARNDSRGGSSRGTSDWEDLQHLRSTLKSLPKSFKPGPIVQAVLRLLDSGKGARELAATCRRLPARLIRALVAKMANSPMEIVIREFVDMSAADEVAEAQWEQAMQTLHDLTVAFPFASKKMRARIQSLAKRPATLAAVQAAVVAAEDPPTVMLAVLAADGSDASVDAMLPFFAKAAKGTSLGLDRLSSLAVHAASTAAMASLLQQATGRVHSRNAASPALAFAQSALGIKARKFKVAVEVKSSGSGWLTTSHVALDSTRPRWFTVTLVTEGLYAQRVTSFGSPEALVDGHAVGGCPVEDLPGWHVHVARELGITWAWDEAAARGPLRNQADSFLRWISVG